MPEFSSHPAGSFCWPELSTTDQKSATAFYRDLLGWTVNDQPMGPGEVYSMFELRGKSVAAAATMPPEERQHGVSPHWNSYVSVASADATVSQAQRLGTKVLAPPFCDATAEKTKELGGTVMVPPTDIERNLRFAVMQDPQGAMFGIVRVNRG